MKKISKDDLYSLEKYALERGEFRARIMAHKKDRRVELGEHIALHFEDRLIMQYQIQEILRAEKIFEAAGIQEEIDAYNALIPDGSNLKATMMIQYGDVDERRVALEKLIGVEQKVWLQVAGHDRVSPIADEDLERETEEKTSAVHFLRFEFTAQMIAGLKTGSALSAGVEHEAITVSVNPLPENIQQSLTGDFD